MESYDVTIQMKPLLQNVCTVLLRFDGKKLEWIFCEFVFLWSVV